MERSLRKLSIDARRALVAAEKGVTADAFGMDGDLVELADVLVESAIGYFALPVGVAPGFLVDGESVDVPLATEEPSVIAAASYAASIIGAHGGFTTIPGQTITTGQIFVEGSTPTMIDALVGAESVLRETAHVPLERMTARGGGWRGCDAAWLPETGLLRFEFHVDVRDAMGANIVNTTAEALRGEVERLTGGRVLMAILTNAAAHRVTVATCSIPVSRLGRSGRSGAEIADRIALASSLAHEDPSRAVTHNKGIMNGITSLALATGNDTRALEAAVHAYASRSGRYRSLSEFRVEGENLTGRIELPVVLGTVGGAAGVHPAARAALCVLGSPGASRLASIAAAVGLAQNFAALFALVSEGIQRGHMGLHAGRVAWAAGRRAAGRTPDA